MIAWNAAFREHGIVVPMWRLHRAVGMGGDRYVAAVAGPDVERDLGDALREGHRAAFAGEIDRVAPLPGAQELIAALLDRGARVVLCSSSDAAELEVYLDLLGVRGRVARDDARTTWTPRSPRRISSASHASAPAAGPR